MRPHLQKERGKEQQQLNEMQRSHLHLHLLSEHLSSVSPKPMHWRVPYSAIQWAPPPPPPRLWQLSSQIIIFSPLFSPLLLSSLGSASTDGAVLFCWWWWWSCSKEPFGFGFAAFVNRMASEIKSGTSGGNWAKLGAMQLCIIRWDALAGRQADGKKGKRKRRKGKGKSICVCVENSRELSEWASERVIPLIKTNAKSNREKGKRGKLV